MTSFNKLPPELFGELAKSMPSRDLMNLSCTSKLIRDNLIRILFTNLSITCPLASDKGMDAFINRWGGLVSHVHLHLRLIPNTSDEDDITIPSLWGTPPSETLKKIVHGQLLPHIDTLSVRFDPEQFESTGSWDGDGWWGDRMDLGTIYTFQDSEDQEHTLQQEAEFIWRAQYTEFFRDVSANQNIRHFTISNLLPRNSSVWERREWKAFLGRLEEFDVSVFGGDNGAGWKASSQPGFADFMESLPDYFMQHATNVIRLRIEAHPWGLFGSAGDFGIRLPLRSGIFPSLRSLTLKNVQIGNELIEFLMSHGDSLQELTLEDCMCDEGWSRDSTPAWADLWKTLRADCSNISKVSVVQTQTPPLAHMEGFEGYEPRPDSESVSKIRKMLEEDESLVLWRYVAVDTKYRMVFEDEERNISCFEAGEDQREYSMLLTVIWERNKNTLIES
ncbi:uncharacterized protein QYS62_008087 [Fusarium acuminatum]|uniref:F-box domain-containing protein n=1 Tax=Fusarium acuminatum TaxID=5515 RepID=A0ABZ2X201_9HYPO